jgi:transposase InsO family protein
VLVWMTRLWPSLLALARVVQPATILRWHRAGFRTYWRRKSQGRRGRPTIEHELRDLIRRMSKENPLWGAPRIHGELLKLGFQVAESTVSKYMIGRRGPPSQSWRTFLRNHADAIVAIDLCVVPTLTFERLFALLVVGHGRRQLLWFAVTRNPSAEWLAQQMTEAFPWNTAPTYLVRDNDRAYGQAFQRRIRAMGIRDRPISPRSPWQNPYAERLIGTLRRECLDHVLIVGEWHLRRMLASYSSYYNESRTHLALEKDAPLRRAIQRCGVIITTPNSFRTASSLSAAAMIFGKDRSKPVGPLPLRPFCPGCIISTRGYDFREGQGPRGSCAGFYNPCSAFSISPARSPMTTQGPMVLPVVTRGMIEPSATRSRPTP